MLHNAVKIAVLSVANQKSCKLYVLSATFLLSEALLNINEALLNINFTPEVTILSEVVNRLNELLYGM